MKRQFLILFVLILTPVAFTQTQPTIVSASTVASSYRGGGTMAIFGSNYLPAPRVFFGAEEGTVISASIDQINVIVPPHRVGRADMAVLRGDGAAVVAVGSFNFINDTHSQYGIHDMVLLPLLMRDVPGANNSRWTTHLAMINRSTVTTLTFTPYNFALNPGSTSTNAVFPTTFFPADNDPNPSRIIYARRDWEDVLTIHLRAQDQSRQAETWGVEVPVVHENEFRVESIQLSDIPTASGFRVALRVYTMNNFDASGNGTQSYRLRIWGLEQHGAPLVDTIISTTTATRPNSDPNLPTFPALYQNFDLVGSFPAIAAVPRVRLVLTSLLPTVPNPPIPLFWAMASVAHNQTQHLTFITPE